MMTVPFYPLNLTIQKSALRADFIIVEDRMGSNTQLLGSTGYSF